MEKTFANTPPLASLHHPIQPLGFDDHDVLRFKGNKIIIRLFEERIIDLNKIACWSGIPVEDREQFWQLLGYSLSGFGELSFVTDITYNTASEMSRTGGTQEDAKVVALTKQLAEANKVIKDIRSLVENSGVIRE